MRFAQFTFSSVGTAAAEAFVYNVYRGAFENTANVILKPAAFLYQIALTLLAGGATSLTIAFLKLGATTVTFTVNGLHHLFFTPALPAITAPGMKRAGTSEWEMI